MDCWMPFVGGALCGALGMGVAMFVICLAAIVHAETAARESRD